MQFLPAENAMAPNNNNNTPARPAGHAAVIAADRLTQLRAERHAVEVAALVQQFEAARRLESMRALGQTLAAEQFTYAVSKEISNHRHDPHRGRSLVPGVAFDFAEWEAFVVGVQDVLALV